MKRILFLGLTFILTFSSLNGQTVRGLKLFQGGKIINSELLGKLPNDIYIEVPELGIGASLSEVNIFTEDFYVETSDGKILNSVDLGKHYQGTIDGDKNTIATFSKFNNSIVLTLTFATGERYELTSDLNTYILRLIAPTINERPNCYTEDAFERNVDSEPNVSFLNGCRSVSVYLECDYKLFTDKGSNASAVTSYVTALFNEVSKLYTNESINIQISQIKIWNTPDPYISSTSIAAVLNKFKSTVGPNFNGNLAHLLTTRSLGGGIAYVDVLCLKSFAFGVSMINTSFQNVPTYSWSVEVVTHELGHNFGSWHTHSCNWPNGALDNCYSTEGGCPTGPAPINGGTIMSYCHLTNYGINFTNGFGIVPGNYIRNKYNSATCLTGSGSFPTGLNTTNITQTAAKISWNAVAGSTYYTLQYKKSNLVNWNTIDSLQATSITLSGLTIGTSYDWRVKTECSSYSPTQTFTTLGNGNSCVVITNVTSSNITNNSALISWQPVPTATSYILEYKKPSGGGWNSVTNILTSSFQLSNLAANQIYIVRVRPNCNLTFSAEFQFQTLNNGGGCQIPTQLNADIITSGWVKLSWAAMPDATSYFIAIKLANQNTFFTLGPINTTSVVLSGLQPNTQYNVKVRSNCSDWSNQITFTTTQFHDVPPTENFKINTPIFPNPATNSITVEGYDNQEFQIYNSIGSQVKFGVNNDGLIEISSLEDGFYIIKIGNDSFKFIVKR